VGNYSPSFGWGCLICFKNPAKMGMSNSKVSFSTFMSEVDSGRVVEVEIQGNNITGSLSDGSKFTTYSPNYPNLVEKLNEKV
jgi:cell division protease FtsH